MIAILWRYRVRPGHVAEFERTYGPDGDWAQLFRRHEGYIRTELLAGASPSPFVPSGVEGPALDYLTIDRWRSHADFNDFLGQHHTDYAALDAMTEPWTTSEEKLGMWTAPDPASGC